MSDRRIGQAYSTSSYACTIKFSGGGPLDGKEGLYDNDFANVTIMATGDDGHQYDYKRAGPKQFRLSKIWIRCGDNYERINVGADDE